MKKKSLYLVALSSFLTILIFGITLHGSNKTGGYEVDWVKLNPKFEGATFVRNTDTCVQCHEESGAKYHETTHGRIFAINPRSALEMGNCESCHGPRSKHIDEPDESLTFSTDQYTEVCMQCHSGEKRMFWQTSLHKTANVGCTSCHSVMEKRSESALLTKSNQLNVCSTCHKDVGNKMNRNSHHPVKEGKIDCSSCHNVHGSPGRGMLTKGGVNETCYSCHQDKRGPFIWEHAPAREDCTTCHVPHGSNNKYLLVTQSATLCVSCHQYGGHINQYRYNRVSTPYGNGCVNCHVTVHGSNHPSGAKFNR